MSIKRTKLILEPYDPNAQDGDGDGMVQDGTAWERPAGVRLFDRAGQEIMPGRISESPVQDLIYRDQNGRTIEYKPKFGGQQEDEKFDGKLGSTLTDRSGSLADSGTLGARVTQQREREAALRRQQQEAEQARAATEAATQRRNQFASIIDNLPTRVVGDEDPFIDLNNGNENINTATAKANLVYGLLSDALNLKADISEARSARSRDLTPEELDEIYQRYPNISPERLDDQIEQLNAAAKALFGMNVEVPVDDRNARKNARLVQELNNAFGKSIQDQGDVLNYVDQVQNLDIEQNLDSLPAERLRQLENSLQQYAGYFEAADTATQTSFDYNNAPQVERQLRDQHYKFLSRNNTVEKVQRAQEKIRDALYKKLNKDRTPSQNSTQGTLDTLYPNIEIQPNHPVLGNLTEKNPNPDNPLPQPTNNPLNIDADLDDADFDPNVERAIITQAAVEHLRNGGSLADIPNDYWYDALSVASSDAEVDTQNPFYRVTPSEGAAAQTTLFWRRNEDGTPSNQGYVTKAAETSQSVAEHAAWNTAAALGIYPEGSNWGGYIDVEPSAAFGDWQETLPVIVAPIVWNHLPTNENLSDLIQNRSYQTDYTSNGAAKRQLAAALHTYLIGDEDRHPGNTMSGYLNGETYIFAIDFGLSGGFTERPDFNKYMTEGGRFNTNSNLLPALAAYRETLTPELRQQLDDELIDTYEAVLQRAEQLLQTNTQDEFIESMLPSDPLNYPDFPDGLARRELAAFYDGIRNAAVKLRSERSRNLRLLLGTEEEPTTANIDVDTSPRPKDALGSLQKRTPEVAERLVKREGKDALADQSTTFRFRESEQFPIPDEILQGSVKEQLAWLVDNEPKPSGPGKQPMEYHEKYDAWLRAIGSRATDRIGNKYKEKKESSEAGKQVQARLDEMSELTAQMSDEQKTLSGLFSGLRGRFADKLAETDPELEVGDVTLTPGETLNNHFAAFAKNPDEPPYLEINTIVDGVEYALRIGVSVDGKQAKLKDVDVRNVKAGDVPENVRQALMEASEELRESVLKRYQQHLDYKDRDQALSEAKQNYTQMEVRTEAVRDALEELGVKFDTYTGDQVSENMILKTGSEGPLSELGIDAAEVAAEVLEMFPKEIADALLYDRNNENQKLTIIVDSDSPAGRAAYQSRGNILYLDTRGHIKPGTTPEQARNIAKRILFHELGHVWDDYTGDRVTKESIAGDQAQSIGRHNNISALGTGFVELRRGNDQPRRLIDILPDKNYQPTETTYEDDFDHPYIGALNQPTGGPGTITDQYTSREVLTVGMEYLYGTFPGFAGDNDHIDFVAGLLYLNGQAGERQRGKINDEAYEQWRERSRQENAERAAERARNPPEFVGSIAESSEENASAIRDLRELRSAGQPVQEYRTRADGRVFPTKSAIDIRRDPIEAGDPYDSFVNWEESEEGKQLANSIEDAGQRLLDAIEEQINGGPVSKEAKEARRKFYEDRKKFVEDIKKRKDKNSLGWSLAEKQILEELRDFAVTQEAKDALNEAIKTADKAYKSNKRKDREHTARQVFAKDVGDLVIEALIAEGAIKQMTPEEIGELPDSDFRKIFSAENRVRVYSEDIDNPLLQKVVELFGPELSQLKSIKTDTPGQPSATMFRQMFGSAGFLGSRETNLRDRAAQRLLTSLAEKNGAPDPDWVDYFKVNPREMGVSRGLVYPPELSNDRIPEIDYLSDESKNVAAFVEVLKSLRDDIGTESLTEIFDEATIRPLQNIGRQDVLEGLERLSKILPGRWIRQFKQSHPRKQAWQWVTRGYYDNGKLAISGHNWQRTMIHELGHAFEQTISGVTEAEKLFYNRRYKQLYEKVKKKPPYRKVSSSGGGYSQNGFPLELNRSYSDVVNTDSDHMELFSMSLQDIYRGKLNNMPPEQIKFVLGVLALL